MEDDHIFKILKIPVNAIEMRAAINFLYQESDYSIFIDSCAEQSLKQINRYIANERRVRLENFVISETEFVLEFRKNKKKALEKLFQEPLNQIKIDFAPNDPEQIFLIHSKLPSDIRFMNFLLHL